MTKDKIEERMDDFEVARKKGEKYAPSVSGLLEMIKEEFKWRKSHSPEGLEVSPKRDLNHILTEIEVSCEEGITSGAGYVNTVLPHLRNLAGYEDSGTGTYREVPEEKDEEELDREYDEIVDEFWEGYYVEFEEVTNEARDRIEKEGGLESYVEQ